MFTVLVTGAGGGVGQGIIKSLKLMDDLQPNIIAADMDALSAGLQAGNVSVLVPSASDTDYISSVINLMKREKVDFYFPGTDVELLVCAQNKEKIESETGATVHVSPSRLIEIADDKYETCKFLDQYNYPSLRTYLVNNVHDIPDFDSYPVVAKPRVGCRSIGVYKVDSHSELKDVLAGKDGYVVQEWAGPDDEEYTCTIVRVGEEIFGPVILKRELRSGDTFRAFPVQNETINTLLEKVAKDLDLDGSCNFQLRMKNGVPYIFEINARLSGTTPFVSQIGFNPVECYMKKILKREYQYEILYNISILRYWTEVVVSNDSIDNLNAGSSTIQNPISVSKLI